jgi:hypothetical protein
MELGAHVAVLAHREAAAKVAQLEPAPRVHEEVLGLDVPGLFELHNVGQSIISFLQLEENVLLRLWQWRLLETLTSVDCVTAIAKSGAKEKKKEVP